MLERHRDLIARAAPFALYMVILALGPVVRPLLPEGADPRWLYGVQVALPLLLLAYLWPHYVELHGPGDSSAMHWLLGTATGVLVFLVWIRLDFEPWVMGTSKGFDPRDPSGRILPALTATRLFGAVLVVPVMEELFWRSFILRWLERPGFLDVDPRTVGAIPIMVSSALFATEHHLWLAGALAGLAYAWLYRKTGNLWIPIMSHAVTNAVLGAWVLRTGAWTFW